MKTRTRKKIREHVNNSELVTFLDRKFHGVNEKLSGLEKGLELNNKALEGLGKELFRFEKRADHDFNDLKGDFRKLQNAVDAYATKADTYFQEMVMLAHKVDRLEKWVLQIAEKVGLRLKS